MAQKKLKVGILMGGRSAEHEVSLCSAKNIVKAIDKKKYEVVLIGIDKSGKWLLHENARFLLESENPRLIKLNQTGKQVTLVPQKQRNSLELVNPGDRQPVGKIDIIFPVLHGPFGEDGTIQGFLKLANIPFVGASVLGSALGMDKDVQKRLLMQAGISVAKFRVLNKEKLNDGEMEKLIAELGLPLFVKPANLGSSVGVSKVKQKNNLRQAIKEAFKFDRKILLEEFIDAREIECSVLGNKNPIASLPGEVMPSHEFYSYQAKYIDENGAELAIPAQLPKSLVKSAQKLAIRAFQVLCCEGMARVDMFLTREGKLYLNEINTIPGFTNISMYPKLWEASGMPQRQLIDKLIRLALERFRREQLLKTTY